MLTAGGQPEYHCQVPKGQLKDDVIPKNDKGEFWKCDMYVGDGTNNTKSCANWTYFGDIGDTIVSQVTAVYRRTRSSSECLLIL